MKKNSYTIRRITLTGVLAAVATVLMLNEFPLPFMPPFIKFDFSEFPALIAAFAYGPVEGVIVCLIKNLIKLTTTVTGGIGELANFLLGVCFVVPAGLIYRVKNNRTGALIGSAVGSVSMAVLSLPINYFIVYPVYSKLMPIEAIISAYQAINPGVDGLFQCLLVFNVPFTLFKGAVDTAVAILSYRLISPFLKGEKKNDSGD